MAVDSRTFAPFHTLLERLPSQTILNPLKPDAPLSDEPDSPTMEIPNLPKNAYGLESFGDYCAAVRRVKEGLPAIEAVTPPDRSEPLLIHGIQFKYWNPDQPESDESETESEATALDTDELQNDRRKSTWSAGTPRKGILRQSTSASVVRETDLPHPYSSPAPLVYDYASTASPSSRCTPRLSSRRVSIDAGVQSEHTDMQNIEEEVARTAAKKRATARRSSITPVSRGSFVHGLAGFTGIGRADSGAVICVANGKKFELVVDKYERNDECEVAVQCSALEIDSEIEAFFGECHKDEVIDVDSLPENMQAEKQTGEEPATKDKVEGDDHPQTNNGENTEEQDEVPSPEQLRSANPTMMTPRTKKIPDLSDIALTSIKEIDKTTPGVITPTHLNLKSDTQDKITPTHLSLKPDAQEKFTPTHLSLKPDAQEKFTPTHLNLKSDTQDKITPTHLSLKSDAQDEIIEDVANDEVVGISAQGPNRLSIQPAALETADAQATPRGADGQPTEKLTEEKPEPKTPGPLPVAQMSDTPSAQINTLPEAQLPGTPPAQSSTPPEPQISEAPPAQTNIHCIAVPTKTPPQATVLAIARQRSLSLKPSSELAVVTQRPSHHGTEGHSLCLRSVPGLNIRPTASAYQLAAMATLSPKSYLRAIQPSSQPRVVFAFASPGGTAPVRGVDVAPPALLSTPPVATLAVAPSSSVRASLIAAPRRSHVSIPRTDLSTPSQGLLPINDSHSGPRGDGASVHINLESEALVTPAPLQNKIATSKPRPSNSQITHSGTKGQSTSKGSITPNIDESKVSSELGIPVETGEDPVGFIDVDDDDDDDFGGQLDMDDDVMMETDELNFERETTPQTDVIKVEADQEAQNPAELPVESVKSRSRKTSVASSRTRASRKTQESSASEQKRVSSVTQAVQDCDDLPSDVDLAMDNDHKPEVMEVENEVEVEEEEAPKKKRSRKAKAARQPRKGGQKRTKRTGKKRWRELESLPTSQVNTNEESTDGALRRSKRQRFPRLKFWKNETVSYERRLSQAIPTIAEVLVDVGASESDDDTWFGRR